MVLALKSHLLHNHQLSSNPFSSIVRSHQTPLFQVQPIQTTSSLSPLQLKPRRKSIIGGFNASYVEEGLERSGNNGGNGGGVEDTRKERGDGDGGGGVNVGEVVRLFLRFAELLMDPERVIVGAVGLPLKLALLCVQAMWQLHLVMIEICSVALLCVCAGGVLISAVIAFLYFQFV
ncbi:hypothetical protein HanRHA438_Chr07g0310141 [Helianthus annuus]|uniref:Transmembrane protein n=1 Tax=Helianthus annuus TaxID=4232 RepID=A0A9K3NG04_HELAN|nr:hypothetical protein HanXRQr2_Chr07g0299871 [Helianthus annuus]KAJ0557307.1 hypothetical protein HanIR_Chr07g0323701 [Helianthus annuus]KAJ0905119.1 hypothetical protein HanPSC8_Chr07g0290311 [Helianthus annuus]KAJ0908411.1 hypothetical protein HanRHA438_Chr07g0310141 [Helianthus annuus]